MWDEKYSAPNYIYGTKPNEFLTQNFNLLPKGKILCLAEGEGRNAVFLAKQGYSVTAVDGSAVGLQKARKWAEENQVSIEFIHADLADYELGEAKWDGIVSIFCHLPVNIRRALHQKVVTSLKQDGVMLLEAYTPDQLNYKTGGPTTADMTMNTVQLTEELNGLQFTLIQEIERDVVEGTHHTGTGAVIQVIAKKP
ncbi:class I SAM-dependent methyltransferase [Thiomicrorhabdus arctica]|jgi:2-polyprenyl-3-methyl-5-hydroxy-6-metoxy-1,4-benzoquinol methylase|uniref:class I SAM-dependent methyltransferase n=1 Tax=Thiomicrorhabdus arctica TaxID=131540 RepID=UPI0003744C96|nr:class I SAM-dependent methyltransferase [Thiomicrorhabdus arctica]